MNKLSVFGIEAELIASALDALHASAGISGRVIDNIGHASDAAVLLEINGQQLKYNCEVKKKVDRYTLPLDVLGKLDSAQHTVLVSSPLSQQMAARCRELGLQFIDTAGNAYLNDGAHIYVYVTGRRGDDRFPISANNTMTPAVLRMMFAFLAEPALLNAPYRDIAYRVHVSIGVIGKSLETLEARGLIGTAGGKRMIRTPELFLNEWVGGYVGRLRPKLKTYRFATDDIDKFIHRDTRFYLPAEGSEPTMMLGGELAAAILTRHLKPEALTIYADMKDPHALREFVKKFRLRADPQGRIEIVEMFWHADAFTAWMPTVPPHLVYADLMATHDARNIAVAKQIAAKVIEHVHATA